MLWRPIKAQTRWAEPLQSPTATASTRSTHLIRLVPPLRAMIGELYLARWCAGLFFVASSPPPPPRRRGRRRRRRRRGEERRRPSLASCSIWLSPLLPRDPRRRPMWAEATSSSSSPFLLRLLPRARPPCPLSSSRASSSTTAYATSATEVSLRFESSSRISLTMVFLLCVFDDAYIRVFDRLNPC